MSHTFSSRIAAHGTAQRADTLVQKALVPGARLTMLALLASVSLPAGTYAAQSTWTVFSGNFTVGTNWNTNPTAPGTGDEAIINSGTATVNSTYTVDQVTIGGGAIEVIAGGTLTVTSGSTMSSGTYDVHGGGTLNGDMSVSGGVFNSNGTVNGNFSQTGGANINTATINGTLTLNGGTFANTGGTVTGATTITTGTLTSTGTLSTVDNQAGGTLNNNGGTTGAVTNAGTITNTGTMASLNTSSGTVSNNTGGSITGTTTITGGTVNNIGTVGTVANQSGGTFNNNANGNAGAVTNNGTASNSGTVASLNQVSGTFTNNASGTITGTTTFTGGTLINAGTFGVVNVLTGNTFNNSGTTGALTNAGTVTNTGTIASVTNNAGSFTNNAGGTVTGTTTMNAGTLVNAGTLGAVVTAVGGSNTGTIASLTNTAGTFTNNTGATISGATTISGGTLVNNGTAGAVTNQSGGTFTNNGTAGAVTNAGTTTNKGTVASVTNTAGTFSNASGATVTGTSTISGGSMTNAGTLNNLDVQSGGTFDNVSGGTINGSITIAGSTLINNGAALGNIQVLSGGYIKGAGNFGTLTINSGATIAPGNSIGTSRISGNLIFASGSFYEVEVNAAGATDLIDVTGNVTLNGGTVKVIAASGNYAQSMDYKILQAGGTLTGQFAGVTSNFTFLDPLLTYRAGAVYLNLTRNDIRFASIGHTPNQRSVGNAIDNNQMPTSVYNAAVGLDEESARKAFEDLSGDIYPSLAGILLDDSYYLRSALTGRLFEDSDEPLWAQAYGSWSRHYGAGNASAVTTGSGGILLGTDAEFVDGWRFGAAGGYGYTAASTGSSRAQADVNSFSAAFYIEGEVGPLSVRSGASYAYHDVDVHRTVAFGGLSENPYGDFDAATRQVFAELAYSIDTGKVKLEPFANLAFADYTSDATQEKGGASALYVPGSYNHAIYSLIGVRFSTDTVIDDTPVAFGGMVGWRHAHDAGGQVSRMYFAGKSGFDVGGAPVVEDTALAELTASIKLAPNASLEFSWQGSYAEQALSQKASVRLGVNF